MNIANGNWLSDLLRQRMVESSRREEDDEWWRCAGGGECCDWCVGERELRRREVVQEKEDLEDARILETYVRTWGSPACTKKLTKLYIRTLNLL